MFHKWRINKPSFIKDKNNSSILIKYFISLMLIKYLVNMTIKWNIYSKSNHTNGLLLIMQVCWELCIFYAVCLWFLIEITLTKMCCNLATIELREFAHLNDIHYIPKFSAYQLQYIVEKSGTCFRVISSILFNDLTDKNMH